jgi:hypothetical protein
MWLDPHREHMMTIAERYCNFMIFTKNHTMQDDVTNKKERVDLKTTGFRWELVPYQLPVMSET